MERAPRGLAYGLEVSSTRELHEVFCQLWETWRTPTVSDCPRPAWIALPEPGAIEGFKRSLLSCGLPIFRVEFLGPAALRERLLVAYGLPDPPVLPRWIQKWLMEETLRRYLSHSETPQDPLIQSLAQDPAPLLESLELLAFLGIPYEELPLFRRYPDLAQAWLAFMRQIPFCDPLYSFELAKRRLQDQSIRLPGDFFAVGFGPEHAATGFLRWLELAFQSFENVALLALRSQGEDPRLARHWEMWVAHWFGANAAHSVFPAARTPLENKEGPTWKFFLTPDQESQRELAVRVAKSWLSRSPDRNARLGIVLPRSNAFALALADSLEKEGLPFFCQLPLFSKPRHEQRFLALWILLQNEGLRSVTLVEFWKVAWLIGSALCSLAGQELTPAELETFLWDQAARTLCQNLLGTVPSNPDGLAGMPPALEAFCLEYAKRRWPAQAPLGDFCRHLVDDASWLLGREWAEALESLFYEDLGSIEELFSRPVERTGAVRFLELFLTQTQPERRGSPWAPIHLCSPQSAVLDRWESLLLLSVNQGIWDSARTVPPPFSEVRKDLGCSCEPVQEKMTTSTPFWEMVIAEPIPVAAQWERFHRAVDREIFCVAAAYDELETLHEWEVAPLFIEAWNRLRPHTPWQEAYTLALLETSRRALTSYELGSSPHLPQPQLDELARIHRLRRDPTKPFDSHSFFVSNPLDIAQETPPLAATEAETILCSPAYAYFSLFLKLEGKPREWTEEQLLALFEGQILHEALARSLPLSCQNRSFGPAFNWSAWEPLPSHWGSLWQKELDRYLKGKKLWLENSFFSSPPGPPPWWESYWLELLAAAQELRQKTLSLWESAGRPSWAATELKLLVPKELAKNILGTPWDWKGKVDLVFLDQPPGTHSSQAWIIDYKTSTNASFFHQEKVLASGTHFQLVVYCALFRALAGAQLSTYAATVPLASQKMPQWSFVDPFAPVYEPLWATLRAAWQSGQFGQAERVKPRYGKGLPFPKSMLPLETGILENKWKLSFPLCHWERAF